MPDDFAVADWGSTRLRLRLLDAARPGAVAEEVSSEGIGSVPAGRQREVFLAALARLLGRAGRAEAWRAGGEVWLSGMVGSTLGWLPTPYVPVPAGPEDLLARVRVEALGGLRLHVLPGVRTSDDVLRGEEVEAIGILGGASRAPAPAVLVLPGTHSKWIRWDGLRIADFITVPTGDLHAGLHRATVISRTLPAEPVAIEGSLLDAFDRGVDLALRDGPLASIFKARSLAVLDGLEAPAASALLSGALIGGEAIERGRLAREGPVLVGGAPRLQALYLRALGRAAIAAQPVPPDLAELASAEGIRILRSISTVQ